MSGFDSVGPSREGDQFHYHWAARQCLELLSTTTDLVAVTIEGISSSEAEGDDVDVGEEVIDVALYFGDEATDKSRLVRYVQLKHSTRRAQVPWTASGLQKTIKGFAARYDKLLDRHPAEDVALRFRFEYTTNRPIEGKVQEALADLSSGGVARHPNLSKTFLGYTGLDERRAAQFFKSFVTEPGEPNLWAQRNLLSQELGSYLPDADSDAPVQLKEMVTRKATTEFQTDPAIRRHDVLCVLKASEDLLRPAPLAIRSATGSLVREQEGDILTAIMTADHPVVIHADAGVGKSVLAARLAASLPQSSVAVLYDCFGDGLHRSTLHFRHRHRDALVQIANELAAQGLCHPLIPTVHAEASLYTRAFIYRLTQATRLLRSRDAAAILCIIIDAADNAQMAAEEQQGAASFVRDLVRTPVPDGVRLVFTCRTHRRELLAPPPGVQQIELKPFSNTETSQHLRTVHPSATDAEVAEFAYLSSSNPRVQALALARQQQLTDILKELGPSPTTVNRAIGELLERAIAKLRDQVGVKEREQIHLICQGLAILRPLVPVAVLAELSQTSESAVRSFALEFGRPLLLKGSSIHFVDEPAETWFRETFKPDAESLARFLERLRPLASHSSYAAAALPQLLLHAGKLEELVELALSDEGLPTANPMARRDVELQRMIFALKACLQKRQYLAAAKLALKAGGETAGEQRQVQLIQDNTDVAAVLMQPDRIEDVVSRRIFSSNWMGSGHAYNAGLLSGRKEYTAEASSQLRMAIDWLRSWARRSGDAHGREEVSDADRAELTMSVQRLQSPDAAADFLRRWTWRRHSFEAGRIIGSRLIDLGQYDQVDALAVAAGNDVWLLLGLASEAAAVLHPLPARPVARLLRLLCDRRVKLEESNEWTREWKVLYGVRSVIEIALQVLPPDHETWSELLRRYLPSTPPRMLADRYGVDRLPMLQAYALEASLRRQKLTMLDVAPTDVRKQLESEKHSSRAQETETYQREVGGLLPWSVLWAEVACGYAPTNINESTQAACKETAAAESRNYGQDKSVKQGVARQWLRIVAQVGAVEGSNQQEFRGWLASLQDPLWLETLIGMCRLAARREGMRQLAIDLAVQAYQLLKPSREDAESRSASYISLARAILAVSLDEARAYFDLAFEISSRVGDENLDRWTSLLHLAKRAGERERPRAKTAYRLSRVAELTYEYVARDKYFDWEGTVEALTSLCAPSAIAILSRWRDRRFGDPRRLLPVAVDELIECGQLPAMTPIAMAGLTGWDRVKDLKRALSEEMDPIRKSAVGQIGYRYLRVHPTVDGWIELAELASTHGMSFPDIERLIAFERVRMTTKNKEQERIPTSYERPERRKPDWNSIFNQVDIGSSEALQAAYAALRTYDPPFEFEEFYREALARASVGREAEFIRAVSMSPEFGIFELRYLLDVIKSVSPRSLSVTNAIRDAVLSACRREPCRVYRRGWSAIISFDELEAQGVVTDSQVVQAMLEGFVEQVEQLDAGGIFKLVEPLAACLRPDAADESLNFGLDLLESTLRPEDGDGQWRSELRPPSSIPAAIAGYIWSGLGSPVVAERWEFAHVVRSLVELGWTQSIMELVERAETADANPFIDTGLEFYTWHARQWMLIGMARGAIENPAAMREVVPLLQRWLRLEHVLIRGLAANTLRALRDRGACDNCDQDLDAVNRPNLPEHVYTNWWGKSADEGGSTTTDDKAEDEKFYFGIDIVPYWFRPLGRAFGLTEHAIERRARRLLRKHMSWTGGGWEKDARHTRRLYQERETYHSHGSLPKADDLTAYYGYHAMMLVAAELLLEKQVGRRDDAAQSDFDEWLSGYMLTRPDGKWLADRRDPRPIVESPASSGTDRDNWRWGVTASYLDQNLKTDDGLLVLWGNWTGGESYSQETISVRSALVSRSDAEALMVALQTSTELDRFRLPEAADDDEESLKCGTMKLRGWVVDRSLSAQLDEHDPWGEDLKYPGPMPSAEVLTMLGVIGSPDGRSWRADRDELLRSETWTHSQGYGDERETVPGTRMSCNLSFLRRLLEAYPHDRMVISVSIRRRPPRHERDRDEPYSYMTPYVRYYQMGADGVAHPI